jgi:phospholipid/cholesterol/gamma-HCH transport system permease protein
MIFSVASIVGSAFITTCDKLGRFALFVATVFKTAFTTKLKIHHTITHAQEIGVNSLPIIFLTGSFTGLALALQSYIGFYRVGAQEFVGLVVTLGMARELGPVLTALMVTGRSGSSMAAEIGTMQITEQIDALKTICINPYQYLIVPRVIATTIMLPTLTMFSVIFGSISGYIFCIYMLGLNADIYASIVAKNIELTDITGGLIKAGFFGFIIASIGTYSGFATTGGARGVGTATIHSVVTGSIMILIANYFLSSILFQTGFA